MRFESVPVREDMKLFNSYEEMKKNTGNEIIKGDNKGEVPRYGLILF